MFRIQNLLFTITFIILAIASCTYAESTQTTPFHSKDSIPSTSKTNYLEYRKINHFNLQIGNAVFDSCYKLILNNPFFKREVVNDLCLGDNCESYQTLHLDSTTIYFFKGDANEYGFSNDQFILINDSLTFARNMNVSIEKWATDSSETIWKIEEFTYYLNPSNLRATLRTGFTSELEKFDFTFSSLPALPLKVVFESAYTAKMLELNELLDLKNSQELD